MGMWSCAEDTENFVKRWVPTLLKDGWPAVRAALIRDPRRTKNEDLQYEIGCVGLAAADIVGGARDGHPDPEMPTEVSDWVKKNCSALDPKLLPLALLAIDRGFDFYQDIWAEGDESLGCQTAAKELYGELGGEIDDEDHGDDAPEHWRLNAK